MLHFEQGQGRTGFTRLDHETDFAHLKLLPDRLAKLYLYLLSKNRFANPDNRKAHWRELGEFTGKSRTRVFSGMAELVEQGLAVGENGSWWSTKNGTVEPLDSPENGTIAREGSPESGTPQYQKQDSSVPHSGRDSSENGTALPANATPAQQESHPELKERKERTETRVAVGVRVQRIQNLQATQGGAALTAALHNRLHRDEALNELEFIVSLYNPEGITWAIGEFKKRPPKSVRFPEKYLLALLEGAGDQFVKAGLEDAAHAPTPPTPPPRFHVQKGDKVRVEGSESWVGVLYASDRLIELDNERYIYPHEVLEHQRAPEQPAGADFDQGVIEEGADPKSQPSDKPSPEELRRIMAELEGEPPDQVGQGLPPEGPSSPVNPPTKPVNEEVHWHVEN